MTAFVKGSPEKIIEMCLARSIPPNFKTVLENYPKEGFRVIALAKKPLDIADVEGI